ncbi:hypothetical protein PV797_11695 [Clostridiaceae bacterium M8S5]|nr:hypothetical protein PV797_11695 [Clostridiaceae bacterium M8S5]
MQKLNKQIKNYTYYIGEVISHCPCKGLPEEAYAITGDQGAIKIK